jgi:membrane protease YdiL (CAAX protease family)
VLKKIDARQITRRVAIIDSGNRVWCNMTRGIDRIRWKVTDILVSLFILVVLSLLFTMVVSRFCKISDLFWQITGTLFLLAPIYYLNSKYPLKLFSNLNNERNLKYFLIGTAMCLLLNAFYGLSARLSRNVPEQYAFFMQYSAFGKCFDLIGSLILAPVLEEIYFRGFIYRILKNRYNVFWGAIGSAVIFALFHGFKSDVVINVGILGMIFVYVYQKTESIILTILTHSICSASWLAFIHHGLNG